MNTNLEQLGWNHYFQSSFDRLNSGKWIPARVVRENRGQYIVNTGASELVAQLSGTFLQEALNETMYPTVGDWIAVEPRIDGCGLTIRRILERRSLFERQTVGDESRNQLVAANFDTLFLVSGLDGDLNLGRIQRYLSLAWTSGAQPVVLLNKADLRDDVEEVLLQVRGVAVDVPIHTISAHDPKTLGCLEEYLTAGQTVALLGSSGVGKSSLINALIGENLLVTQANREDDSRGRHTTTWRELVALESGGMVIDLPGMRELQLTGEEGGIERTFSDVEALAEGCRFRNCHHNGELGCAVEEAVYEGILSAGRLAQYRKLKYERGQAAKRSGERRRKVNSKVEKHRGKDQYFKKITMQKRKETKTRRRHGGDGF